MKSIGIVAEYNPIHIGHAYQLSYIAERWPQATRIVVMSGSFVQRGLPAFFSKYDRASWAILSGADLVIELPSVFAIRSAEIFASGAMRLLSKMKVDAFSFGSEISNLDLLDKTAQLTFDDMVQKECQKLLRTGLSYGAALRQAISAVNPAVAPLLQSPNALLGIEYLRAVYQYDLPLIPLIVKRESSYHRKTLDKTRYPSATALRLAMEKTGYHDLSPYFTEEVGPLVENALKRGAYSSLSRYYDLLLYAGRTLPLHTLSLLGDFSEGIENRWKEMCHHVSWPLARDHIKTKRYSYARIDRMAAYTLLSWTQETLQKAHRCGPLYARVLAFNQTGRLWLRDYQGDLPIVTKWGKFIKSASGTQKDMALSDIMATDVQALTMATVSERKGGADFFHSSIYIE